MLAPGHGRALAAVFARVIGQRTVPGATRRLRLAVVSMTQRAFRSVAGKRRLTEFSGRRPAAQTPPAAPMRRICGPVGGGEVVPRAQGVGVVRAQSLASGSSADLYGTQLAHNGLQRGVTRRLCPLALAGRWTHSDSIWQHASHGAPPPRTGSVSRPVGDIERDTPWRCL